MSAFLTLLRALPEILVLIKQIQKAVKENETDHTVKSGVQEISKAFAEKDPAALNALFNKSK